MANQQTIQFDGGLTVYVQAITNATLGQTVTLAPPSGSAAQFTGSSEGNIQMTLADQGFLSTGSGWLYFQTPGDSSQNSTYTITCTNSGPYPSNVSAAVIPISTPSEGTFYLGYAISEDYFDGDFNDAVLIFTAWATPQSA